jgi:multidrug transporter EmrE-like cation transporter
MNATSFALILTGVLLNAAAQLLLKAGTNALGVLTLSRTDWATTAWGVATNPHIGAGLACYVVSVVVWIGALSRVEVSVAYPMLSIGYVVNALAAWYLFGEAVTLQRWIGIGFIAVGVWLLVKSA